MDWKDVATVELPAGAQTGDLVAVVDQLKQQVRAVLSPKSAQPDAPHVKALAAPVEDAFEALVAAHDALLAAEKLRPSLANAPSNRDTANANGTADDAWRAMAGFLDAARTLPDDIAPGRAEAEQIHARLFGSDGLRFINYRPRRQWDAAQRLLDVLQEPSVREVVDGLGGTRFAKAVISAQRDFGLAFGFTQSTPVDPSLTSTRAQQLALQGALRDYLVKVAGQVSAKRPETGALARYLLQPYADLVDDLARAPRAVSLKQPTPAPSPEPPKPTE